MSSELETFDLWQRTLGDEATPEFRTQREILRQAFLSFRAGTAQLVGAIGGELPHLTVHDITHIDALWRVAGEIIGTDYSLNPAEAFVLGGAFLLHDAAHVLAAYEDGVSGVKKSAEWRDLIAQNFDGVEPVNGSPSEKSALFQILRHLHAKQARRLPITSWKVPGTSERLFLLEHSELRKHYGDLIGEIAESHHWPAHRVSEVFEHRHLSAPGFLAPASWSVDALKIAFLLRVADAAHIDSLRAPWFLFALRRPDGISRQHWTFQTKLGQPVRTDRGELRLSSGSPFMPCEQSAWWLAYDTACMIDSELRAARTLMRDAGRNPFPVSSVERVTSPETFSTNVQTSGWEPVAVVAKIGDPAKIIRSLGGAAVYGDHPHLAVRELIQNGVDAIRALRALGGLDSKEGRIELSLIPDGDITWLHVTDTGVGMSRFVLTDVLLDFGNSLWSGETSRSEFPGLASTGFKAIGRFGIGFFSVFMLGKRVEVSTRRYRRNPGDRSDQWILAFENGLEERPILRQPTLTEEMPRSGTRISVAIDRSTLNKLLASAVAEGPFDHLLDGLLKRSESAEPVRDEPELERFYVLVGSLCPTLDIEVRVIIKRTQPQVIVAPDDWKSLSPAELTRRLYPGRNRISAQRMVDLSETSGAIVGRIAYDATYGAQAIVTHRGLISGVAPALAGVVLGSNNEDLARGNSTPIGSEDAWRRWATEWIGRSEDHFSVEELVALHPIVPERDFRIYRRSGQRLSATELVVVLAGESQIVLCDQFPEYDDFRDDVSKNSFENYFQADEEIVFLPTGQTALAKWLGFPSISYSEQLEAILKTAWGGFDQPDIDEQRVGEVEGTSIKRFIKYYVRLRESSESNAEEGDGSSDI